MLKKKLLFLLVFNYLVLLSLAADFLTLRTNLQNAQPGDFLVIAAGKTNSLMHIYSKKEERVTIEEVVIPQVKCFYPLDWHSWISQGAPGHTSWVMYDIDLKTGQMIRYYSFTKKGWFDISDADNFLSKLLNLPLTEIPDSNRKKTGTKSFSSHDRRALWQPRLVLEGQTIKNVSFSAWKTQWPKDGSDLSGKTIEIYLPHEHHLYPSYFPYWLQINGAIGRAKIRMIDSGRFLKSPRPSLDCL